MFDGLLLINNQEMIQAWVNDNMGILQSYARQKLNVKISSIDDMIKIAKTHSKINFKNSPTMSQLFKIVPNSLYRFIGLYKENDTFKGMIPVTAFQTLDELKAQQANNKESQEQGMNIAYTPWEFVHIYDARQISFALHLMQPTNLQWTDILYYKTQTHNGIQMVLNGQVIALMPTLILQQNQYKAMTRKDRVIVLNQ